MVEAETEGSLQRSLSKPRTAPTSSTAVYDELQLRARQHHRHVEEEATLTLLAAIGAGEALPPDMAAALAALIHPR